MNVASKGMDTPRATGRRDVCDATFEDDSDAALSAVKGGAIVRRDTSDAQNGLQAENPPSTRVVENVENPA